MQNPWESEKQRVSEDTKTEENVGVIKMRGGLDGIVAGGTLRQVNNEVVTWLCVR